MPGNATKEGGFNQTAQEAMSHMSNSSSNSAPADQPGGWEESRSGAPSNNGSSPGGSKQESFSEESAHSSNANLAGLTTEELKAKQLSLATNWPDVTNPADLEKELDKRAKEADEVLVMQQVPAHENKQAYTGYVPSDEVIEVAKAKAAATAKAAAAQETLNDLQDHWAQQNDGPLQPTGKTAEEMQAAYDKLTEAQAEHESAQLKESQLIGSTSTPLGDETNTPEGDTPQNPGGFFATASGQMAPAVPLSSVFSIGIASVTSKALAGVHPATQVVSAIGTGTAAGRLAVPVAKGTSDKYLEEMGYKILDPAPDLFSEENLVGDLVPGAFATGAAMVAKGVTTNLLGGTALTGPAGFGVGVVTSPVAFVAADKAQTLVKDLYTTATAPEEFFDAKTYAVSVGVPENSAAEDEYVDAAKLEELYGINQPDDDGAPTATTQAPTLGDPATAGDSELDVPAVVDTPTPKQPSGQPVSGAPDSTPVVDDAVPSDVGGTAVDTVTRKSADSSSMTDSSADDEAADNPDDGVIVSVDSPTVDDQSPAADQQEVFSEEGDDQCLLVKGECLTKEGAAGDEFVFKTPTASAAESIAVDIKTHEEEFKFTPKTPKEKAADKAVIAKTAEVESVVDLEPAEVVVGGWSLTTALSKFFDGLFQKAAGFRTNSDVGEVTSDADQYLSPIETDFM